MEISVILATWRRPEPTQLVLGDLARQQAAGVEVIVIDQNRPPMGDEIYAELRASPHSLKVLTHGQGVVAARRAGVEASSGRVLVFIDDDVRIRDPRFLAQHAANYTDPEVMAVCGQELSPPSYQPRSGSGGESNEPFEQAMFFNRASTERRVVSHLATCNCSLRRTAWDRIGGLDMAFAGNSYGDDYDLALRMHSAGMRIVFDPLPSVEHTRAPMGGLRLDDPRNTYAEWEKYVSLWVFHLRHVPAKWRRWNFKEGILRKSLLLKRNALRPWCWPGILAGLWKARRVAKRALQAPAGSLPR
jgi:GT2 family glycosyltransferase